MFRIPWRGPSRQSETAWAKVNLALHVVGRRADGYHLLDSLVAFPRIGDLLVAEPATRYSLVIEGPFAAGLDAGPDNLALRAARAQTSGLGAAALRLVKNLPVAAGIGGGSADAAAAIRLLQRCYGLATPPSAVLVSLGADVPVCVGAPRPARMGSIGEEIEPIDLPPFWLVLANPGVPTPTGAVFAAREGAFGAPLGALPRFADAAALAGWLAAARNDLEAPARRIVPQVAETLAALSAQPGCLIARMSGSGATCFGLFASAGPAGAARDAIRRARPGWWVEAAPVWQGPGTDDPNLRSISAG